MPLSKERDKERKRLERSLKRRALELKVGAIMSSANVRAMRAAGITPGYVEDESGSVASRVFYALLRDRDAIKAHLSWLQNDLRMGRIILNGQYGKQNKE